MAVSVAAGVPYLGRYPVRGRDPVLLYAAEDAPHIVRARLGGLCASVHVLLDSLDVHVIVDPVVRLDVDADRARLRADPEPPRTPVQRVLVALAGADAPLTRRELRDTCHLRNASLVDALAALTCPRRASTRSSTCTRGRILGSRRRLRWSLGRV
jgi:hypothetical protein